MNDGLRETIERARAAFWASPVDFENPHDGFETNEEAENAAIASAIRSKWPWIDWPCVTPYRIYEKHCILGSDEDTHCCNCGSLKPKPGPATGDGFSAVVKGKKVEAGDVVKLNDDGTVSKVTPEDEKGEDAEAIRMWRDK